MAYCRFSTPDCDVYVYESVHGGWDTHIKGRRPAGNPPPGGTLGQIMDGEHSAYTEAESERWAYIEKHGYKDIELPHAGESFTDPDPQQCADRLKELRTIGYLVPQYVIDDLEAEAAEDG